MYPAAFHADVVQYAREPAYVAGFNPAEIFEAFVFPVFPCHIRPIMQVWGKKVKPHRSVLLNS
jgi:hypothetical protein